MWFRDSVKLGNSGRRQMFMGESSFKAQLFWWFSQSVFVLSMELKEDVSLDS